ncbi:MAG: hypothetical protein PHO44_09260 [Sphaerochaetaceae bacterium]|nr:hypothetical protein [Sphaerochaetaceae bacterium]MDD3163347.1 hypothetical protein [Sphaerochaetaceae bacterium]MDD4008152.1 hypothetical protein [Sphaerochaetaceae bacterium]MDD4397891.1 hypothetical protein [Sphaerochaetaceae bacterium]
MKKTLLIIMALLCLMVSIGCKDEVRETFTSVTIDACAPDLEQSKTIAPPAESMKISTYLLSGTGPDGEKLEAIESTTGKFTLSNIRCGLWSFEASALNSSGNPIAKGSRSQEIKKSTATASILMNELPGKGRLEIEFAISGDFYLPSASEAQIVIELFDQKNQSRSVFTRPIDRNSMNSALTQEAIHAGSYEISAILYKDNEMVTSAITAVRIVGSATTRGSMTMVVDDASNLSDVSVTNDVSAPISGTILVQKKGTGNQFKSYLLLFKPSVLPSGLTENDLTYKWYCGGIPVKNGNCRTCEVSPDKDSQYTIIVTSSKQGSTGSTSVTLKALDNSNWGGAIPKSV